MLKERQEVRVQQVPILVSEPLKRRIEGQSDYKDWVWETFDLACSVEREEIFQKIGEGFERLKLINFSPLPVSGGRCEMMDFPVELINQIRRFASSYTGKMQEWVSRAYTLDLRAPFLSLYRLRDGRLVEATSGNLPH